jgi:hypothetical protein
VPLSRAIVCISFLGTPSNIVPLCQKNAPTTAFCHGARVSQCVRGGTSSFFFVIFDTGTSFSLSTRRLTADFPESAIGSICNSSNLFFTTATFTHAVSAINCIFLMGFTPSFPWISISISNFAFALDVGTACAKTADHSHRDGLWSSSAIKIFYPEYSQSVQSQ